MADRPSREIIDVIEPRARENQNPEIMEKLFSPAVLPMTKNEAVDFWSRVFTINMPELTIKPWQAKLMANTSRFDYMIRNSLEIDRNIFLYPSEL